VQAFHHRAIAGLGKGEQSATQRAGNAQRLGELTGI